MSRRSEHQRILVAEDSPTQAQRLAHILEEEGYKVDIAANGRLALDATHTFVPALIISDVVMPEMDGYDLCRHVKSDPLLNDVPVILVTTLSDPHDVIRGLECRADNFIVKPYDASYLLSRVQYVLINRQLRRGDQPGMGVEIYFNGEKHFIDADRLQILNLLLSTYDAAIQRNKELKRTQEELRLSNMKLEAVNKELESFAYSVSHDLQAPLRHIDGYMQLLADAAGAALPPAAQRYMNVIHDVSQQMSRLIDDLLAFSRMGRIEMREGRFELNDLVPAVIESLEMATRGRDIVWTIPPLPAVEGDSALIRLVLVNLLGNAVKYTRRRSTACIEVGCAGEEHGRLVLFVRDNGVGFDMQHAANLFGVFQRLHAEREFEGSGIGLANVQRIITRHGGRVWAEGAVEQGATFYFTLKPASPPQ